jgi:hypothetical protein
LIVGAALGLASALLLLMLGFGPRPDLLSVVQTTQYRTKLTYLAAFTAFAFHVVSQLGRPDALKVKGPWLLLFPVGVALLLALTEARMTAVSHHALRQPFAGLSCIPAIFTVALPVFGGLVWALRQLAPTRLRLAGAAAGLCAGGAGALVYSLHCMSVSPTFVLTHYSIAIVGTAALGAASGSRLLRWS